MADFESTYLPGGGLSTTTNVAGYPGTDPSLTEFYKQMAMQRMMNPISAAPAAPSRGLSLGGSRGGGGTPIAQRPQVAEGDRGSSYDRELDRKIKRLQARELSRQNRMVPKKYVTIGGSTLLTDDWDAAPYWMRPQSASIQASPGPSGHGGITSLEDFANARQRTAYERDKMTADLRGQQQGQDFAEANQRMRQEQHNRQMQQRAQEQDNYGRAGGGDRERAAWY